MKRRKCRECGEGMTTKVENHLYDRHGIKATLKGVPVHRCADCGAFMVSIPRLAELNRALTRAVLARQGLLQGTEIRFLRKALGWAAADFAAHLAVNPATLSRWENGKQTQGESVDRLMRLVVSRGTPIADYSLHDLQAAYANNNVGGGGRVKLWLEPTKTGSWRVPELTAS